LRRILHGEIIPILMLTSLGIAAYVFWDQILNLLNLQRATDQELRYISRKVGGYLKYSLTHKSYHEDKIEHELVQDIYDGILDSLGVKAMKKEVTVYHSPHMEI
jgi:hypothetical protein